MIPCAECNVEMEKFVFNKRRGRMIEVSLCMKCWKKANIAPKQKTTNNQHIQQNADETSALLIGGVSVVKKYRLYGVNVPEDPSAVYYDEDPNKPHQFDTRPVDENSDDPDVVAAQSSECTRPQPVLLDHRIFDSRNGWRRAESMAHPTLRLRISTEAGDYKGLGVPHPNIMPTYATCVTDTGAQSCLWGLQDFYNCGFKDSDLLPVKRTMVAANREEITISGAIFLRLSAKDAMGNTFTAGVMVYVSPSTNKFYLSRQALIQLCVIPKDFPRVGAFAEMSSIENCRAACGCLKRDLPPTRPSRLPFDCCPENNSKMREWFGAYYASSTFNKCPHQKLEGMTGPELQFHVKPNASFNVAHTPATVPLHDQDAVKRQIDADVALGVLEKVPYNEPSVCCHRMVVTRKADGSPRRTVDMSALNQHCLRETHHVKPPFQQAKSIPSHTWKSVTDAWNGYHSVPLREQDRYLTTFITPWGRYRYRVAPQGSAVSGDAYARRYDEIIQDIERKTKCVDDTALWDDSLEDHWWRMIDFVELAGRNGVVLNFDKFQFAQREVEFAGFHVTETTVKPLDKFLKAILDFPTPKKTKDIRAWFGLVNHVSHYNRLLELVEPFRVFLGKNKKFEWNSDLDRAFQESKCAIVDAIKHGVEIFDINRATCLQTDFSEIGIGYFLSQKHCACQSVVQGCCKEGWRITLAGSRFLKPAESRYCPVEGEALVIAWALEQTKYFTQGCDNLTVTTDHKPLVGLFGSKSLDQITNPRLFSLKQRTLPWRFNITHQPGKENKFPDAASRFPCSVEEENDMSDITISEILASIMVEEPEEETIDSIVVSPLSSQSRTRAITWDIVREETAKEQHMKSLVSLINSVFPEQKNELPSELVPYWPIRNNLYVVDGVILMKDKVVLPHSLRDGVINEYIPEMTRIIIPPTLRDEVVSSLHSAHQGVSSMNERAKAGVFWPGITSDIIRARQSCRSCNKNMPSLAKPDPIEPHIPTTPFEAIACDYFHYLGHYYFVAADRLSGWVEVQQIIVGTNQAGAQGLCTALRRLMVTFGVPVEVSSDGGPEFTADETQAFFERWGIRHRISSVGFPQSNGRAELAVKTAKRLLEDNVDANGKLDNDKMVRALLTHRNTPDAGCKLSPAQILLGRPLRDTLPYLNKDIMAFNNPRVNPQWRDAWKAKEEALKERYVKTLESLNEHARPLPPLRQGNHVMVQNQRGRFPKKWDHSGLVVETKPNDQYVVKLAGSGRLTLRNRRFLRQYDPHVLHGSPSRSSPSGIRTLNAIPTDNQREPVLLSTPMVSNDIPPPVITHSPLHRSTPAPVTSTPTSPTPATPTRAAATRASDEHFPTPRRVSFGDIPSPVVSPPDREPVTFEGRSRSSRSRAVRKMYDADSGTYKTPSAVPETV